MEAIKKLLSNLNGVIKVSRIPESGTGKILELETMYEKNGAFGLKNIGMRTVLSREFVFAILKDQTFRSPPAPTVLMVEDYFKSDNYTDHLITIDDRSYRIIGEEIIDKNIPEKEEHIFISNDFVLYPKRRTGTKGKPAYFIIPPIGFTELEEKKKLFRIGDIVSISPSTASDEYIRKLLELFTGEEYATILVGFNSAQELK